MPAEKAQAIVLRTTDWSETSRIATLWTREFGKVRVLAKGGRRIKSNFENALDLLTLCTIVFLPKSSGGLNILTEAQVVQRFSGLRRDLHALYAAYYVAELLADWTEDYDSHPHLFDEAVDALRTWSDSAALAPPTSGEAASTGEAGPNERSDQKGVLCTRLLRFELVLLRELGYSPVLENCALCGGPLADHELAFSAFAGGMLCPACQMGQRERRPLSKKACHALQALSASSAAWREPWEPEIRSELRQLLSGYVTYLMGRRPRLSPYLGS